MALKPNPKYGKNGVVIAKVFGWIPRKWSELSQADLKKLAAENPTMLRKRQIIEVADPAPPPPKRVAKTTEN